MGVRKLRVLSDKHKAKLVAASSTRRFQSSRAGSVERITAENTRDRDYAIDAPVQSVVLDFLSQVTRVGGLISQIGR